MSDFCAVVARSARSPYRCDTHVRIRSMISLVRLRVNLVVLQASLFLRSCRRRELPPYLSFRERSWRTSRVDLNLQQYIQSVVGFKQVSTSLPSPMNSCWRLHCSTSPYRLTRQQCLHGFRLNSDICNRYQRSFLYAEETCDRFLDTTNHRDPSASVLSAPRASRTFRPRPGEPDLASASPSPVEGSIQSAVSPVRSPRTRTSASFGVRGTNRGRERAATARDVGFFQGLELSGMVWRREFERW